METARETIMKNKGMLLIISGCAGSGKGTVISELFKISDRFVYSVSMTTRKPRPGEINGKNYFFVTKEEFLSEIENDMFLEYAEYCDNFYGTPKKPIDDAINNGKIVILEIETDGAMQIMQKENNYISIFLAPPNYTTLEYRLRNRDTESEDVIIKRMEKAKGEIKLAENYDEIVINYNDMAKDTAETILAICTKNEPKKHISYVNNKTEFINNFLNN